MVLYSHCCTATKKWIKWLDTMYLSTFLMHHKISEDLNVKSIANTSTVLPVVTRVTSTGSCFWPILSPSTYNYSVLSKTSK